MYKSITFKITATIKCYKDPAGRIIEVNSKTSMTQKIFCQFKVSVVGERRARASKYNGQAAGKECFELFGTF